MIGIVGEMEIRSTRSNPTVSLASAMEVNNPRSNLMVFSVRTLEVGNVWDNNGCFFLVQPPVLKRSASTLDLPQLQ